jgi:hypothetical protein
MSVADVPPKCQGLAGYLDRVPGVTLVSAGEFDGGGWWIKLGIDLDHDLAWHVVQEFGHVLNYLSIEDRLPTTFMPVSPPPYLNGGPRDFLSWVVECNDPEFHPETAMQWLEGRLPRPVDDVSQWDADER